MASDGLSLPDQIRQLNDARVLVLGDVKYYPSVVKSILPIVGPTSAIELRRWGAEFLAEAFATPALPNGEKETMQPFVLATLESLVENEAEDEQVLRSVIQTAASIYPLAMRWIINNGYDTVTWERMVGIKQRILRTWDQATPSVKICCIKFAQRVILAQTPSNGAESRYGGALDVSLDKVPPNHQSLDPGHLEAEGMGLLDRMLSVLHESSDALIIDATLNCLSILVRTRPPTANRIINALLNFDPLRLVRSPITPKMKVTARSTEKTSRLLLIHLAKRDPHNPIVPRIQQHVERTMRAVVEALDETGRKRALENQQHDGLDAKRQRVVPEVVIPPLGPGPHSLADVFSLTETLGLKTFDISQVPPDLITKLAVTTLTRIEPQLLIKATNAVRSRLDILASAPVPELNPNTAPLGVDDDDDDYEPDFFQAEDTEQILNKLDSSPPLSNELATMDAALGLKSFHLPQPQALTTDMALSAGNETVSRVLELVKSADELSARKIKAGFTRLAASSGVKEPWVTTLIRLATRSSAGIDETTVKGEDEITRTQSLGANIRDVLYGYIMEDFRKHIDVAVTWLCEEWYNDKMLAKAGDNFPMHYEKCTLRLIDGFLPYIHPQDKVITRFLSELPELNRAILSRVKIMCRDPSVVQLALTSLLYLVMMRPPVKEIALDTVQGIWSDYEDARPMAAKYLSKYRPGFIEEATRQLEGDGAVQSTAAPIAT
ncbi:unnamed protein product [Clonostachys rosea f. rosea IK726]|uniref:Symplekin/Pta1 N-terminal domain-containing protein n=2 Tax=Bionectria ochroleuca TaxID=29856 RepID=A0A0B7JUF6_BIOOC|nr:unnamed protein product [Clonostachys rosea f. rosea IK726]